MQSKQKPKHRVENIYNVSITKVLLYCLAAFVLFDLGYAGIFIYKVLNPSVAFEKSEKPQSTAMQPKPSAEPSTNVIPVATSSAPASSPSSEPYAALLAQADPDFMKDKANILVLGLDKSIERQQWGSFRTDTMIIIACDFKNKTLHMISLPRDTLVPIYPFNKKNKINSAFAAGGGDKKNGYEYALKTASNVLEGIPIDYYIGFDMTVVKLLVDAMGGVDYNVDIDVLMNGRVLEKGMQHLNGQQVLDYCRQRHGSSDIARVDRQQRILFEIFGQMKSRDQIKNLPEIFKALQQNIQTNLNSAQICSLAYFAKDLNIAAMQRYTLPGSFLDIDHISYWGVNESAKKKLLQEIFGSARQTKT